MKFKKKKPNTYFMYIISEIIFLRLNEMLAKKNHDKNNIR